MNIRHRSAGSGVNELAKLMGYESTVGYGLIGNRENTIKALEIA